jgi:hypothetical protein
MFCAACRGDISEYDDEVRVMHAGLSRLLSGGDYGFRYGTELVFFLEVGSARNNDQARRSWIRRWLIATQSPALQSSRDR